NLIVSPENSPPFKKRWGNRIVVIGGPLGSTEARGIIRVSVVPEGTSISFSSEPTVIKTVGYFRKNIGLISRLAERQPTARRSPRCAPRAALVRHYIPRRGREPPQRQISKSAAACLYLFLREVAHLFNPASTLSSLQTHQDNNPHQSTTQMTRKGERKV